MKIGVAKEIKTDEYRVALTPAGARELVQRGHDVIVETGAGDGSSFPDAAYQAVGAGIGSVDDVWGEAELLLKVKEPVESEYGRLRDGLVLFTYLHIAADEPLTRALVESGIAAVAYETVETDQRALPLLAPMSEIAGRLAAQAGAYFLEKPLGGRGLLLAGVRGGGSHALLRREHARSGSDHVDESPDERDLALRGGDRGARPRGGGRPRPRLGSRRQRPRRPCHLRSRRRSPRPRVHAARGRAPPDARLRALGRRYPATTCPRTWSDPRAAASA